MHDFKEHFKQIDDQLNTCNYKCKVVKDIINGEKSDLMDLKVKELAELIDHTEELLEMARLLHNNINDARWALSNVITNPATRDKIVK